MRRQRILQGARDLRVRAAERVRATPEASRVRVLLRAPPEDLLLVVAAHDDGAGLPSDVEHAERVGPARDEVADEDEAVAHRESDTVQKSIELRRAPVNVSDDDRTSHRPLLFR